MNMKRCRNPILAAAVAAALLGGCAVGPNYHRPSAPVPTRFKEAQGWKPAEPREVASGSDWWSVYEDQTLDGLEKQIDVSNQTLKASEASWREAVALIAEARSEFFPIIGVTATGTRSGGPGASAANVGAGAAAAALSRPKNQFELAGTGSWDIDIWGKIRRTLEANIASARASEAELAAARLSAQATLASDYIELRVSDEQQQLLDETVEAYKRSLQITQNQYKVGVAAKTDVITAETQLEGAESQQIAVGVTRATLEHALAVLVGKPPGDFALPRATLGTLVPVVPLGVPSALLERRPDIAAAERTVAAANAEIGVNVAGYFPQVTLTGEAGTQAVEFSQLFSGPTFFWSVGPEIAQTLFNGGKTHGLVQESQESYQADVAAYRQTVLTAFQQVQDNLTGLLVLKDELVASQSAVKSAQTSLDVATNEYKAGTEDYLFVITAQATLLSDQVNEVNLRTREMTTAVLLVQALGGGWDKSMMPNTHQVSDVPEAQAQINNAKPAALPAAKP